MSRKKILVGLVLILPVVITGICCWSINRRVDINWAFQEMGRSNAILSEAIETHAPDIDSDRIADSIIYIYADVFEIGLYALDFSVTPSEDSTIFSGTISNFGDRTVSAISATIWLLASDGDVVDWVDVVMPISSLDPSESVEVTGTHVPRDHPYRLLYEGLYLPNQNAPIVTFSYMVGPVVVDPKLAFISRIFPSIRHRTQFTNPEVTWTDWELDLSCEGEPN